MNNTYNAKMAYYYYSTEDVSNPTSKYMDQTVAAFGLNSKQQLYNFFGTMDWMIQDYTLGGLIAKRNLKELVLGWNSSLIQNIGFVANPQSYTDYYFKTGDAIVYNAKITPFIVGDTGLMNSSNTNIKVNTGSTDASKTGRIETINGYTYPNKINKVWDGQSSFLYLPFRCSDADFSTTDVYAPTQGAAGTNTTNIYTLNMVNQQVVKQDFNSTESLCVTGVGSATCNADYNTEYNSEPQNKYSKTA
jgi:hypothetical protein